MEEQGNRTQKSKITLGLLAHVDAGKTTLSEALLYSCGSIRKLGRVDRKDTFLDTMELERKRGITIFSKQAGLLLNDWDITLLDTPGHVDFSAEMERSLQVLDYAVLIVSGPDGVQGHTKTLWKLLRKYRIPVFIFVNKMDQEGTDASVIFKNIKDSLSMNCVDFTHRSGEQLLEEIAVCDEESLEQFLKEGTVSSEKIRTMLKDRKIFPVFFGSALKMQGIEEMLNAMRKLFLKPSYGQKFGARVFKIARDGQGSRLTFLKITGGSLKVKDVPEELGEKVNQIRLYSGEKYEITGEAPAGTVCAVTGLSKTVPGQGLGAETAKVSPVLVPFLTYTVHSPGEEDRGTLLLRLRLLEEEIPEIHVLWDEEFRTVQIQVMGTVQMEVLQHLMKTRFGEDITFDEGNILYKETIAAPVEGVGHYEPLRHYAEVHLLMEPMEPGSGLSFESRVREDDLDLNWQRLILTHLKEKEHRGVLTGSVLTDVRITLVAGKAHLKHTEGGDFRQATYRAVRQGLMCAESVLLEPVYEFRLEVPEFSSGRAMSDLNRKNAKFEIEQTGRETTVLTGTVPAACVKNYQQEVSAYTKGRGQFSCTFREYSPCHNAQQVIEETGYQPESDTKNPADSVFCFHGAGTLVHWPDVPRYMHLPFQTECREDSGEEEEIKILDSTPRKEELPLGTEEVDRILEKTVYANKRKEKVPRHGYLKKTSSGEKVTVEAPVYRRKNPEKIEEYLLVDGYNVIFAWEDLKELAQTSMDGARGKLQDILCNYQAMKGCRLILVFDAYRIEGHDTEIFDYHNIHVVFTKEAETADQYIEKFAHEYGRKYHVTVATSDGLEQIIIRGQGCRLLSSRELKKEIERTAKEFKERTEGKNPVQKTYLKDHLSEEILREMSDGVTD